MSKIRVLVVDDHAMLRAGLQMAVNSQLDMEVVGQARSGNEAIAVAYSCRPNVVLLDLTLPDVGGAEVTEQILADLPGVNVLAVHGGGGRLQA